MGKLAPLFSSLNIVEKNFSKQIQMKGELIVDENNIEHTDHSMSKTVIEDFILYFFEHLVQNVDLNAIMRMENDLLPVISNGHGQRMQIPILNPQGILGNWTETEWILINKENSENMYKTVNELIEVKKELVEALAISEILKKELEDERAKNQGNNNDFSTV
jgi:hypothetical protein